VAKNVGYKPRCKHTFSVCKGLYRTTKKAKKHKKLTHPTPNPLHRSKIDHAHGPQNPSSNRGTDTRTFVVRFPRYRKTAKRAIIHSWKPKLSLSPFSPSGSLFLLCVPTWVCPSTPATTVGGGGKPLVLRLVTKRRNPLPFPRIHAIILV